MRSRRLAYGYHFGVDGLIVYDYDDEPGEERCYVVSHSTWEEPEHWAKCRACPKNIGCLYTPDMFGCDIRRGR